MSETAPRAFAFDILTTATYSSVPSTQNNDLLSPWYVGWDNAQVCPTPAQNIQIQWWYGVFPDGVLISNTGVQSCVSSNGGNPWLNSFVANSNLSGAYYMTATSTDGDFYAPISYDSGLDEIQVGDVFDMTTRFIQLTPLMGTSTPYATSTTFVFGATVFVNPTEFVASSTELYMRWRQLTGMGLRGNSVVGMFGECTVEIEQAGSSTPAFCTDEILNTGAYLAYYEIRVPQFSVFGIEFFHDTLVSTVGNFVVGAGVPSGEYLRSVTAISTTGPSVDAIVDPDAVASSTGFFLNFLDVPNLLRTKAPFAYIFQISNLMQTASSVPASTNSSLTLSFVPSSASTSPLGSVLSNVVVFSTSTVSSLIPSSALSALRALQVGTIWLAVGFLMFREGLKAIKHKA